MLKQILSFIIPIVIAWQCVKAENLIYLDRNQKWVLTGVASNDDYTVISCDIVIRNNRAGCMDAHTYDKRNSSIYIYGSFGRKNIIASEFEGNYKPWEMYPGHYEWNYYKKHQKERVAHARFVFPRIPAGVKTIGWHYDGGWADEAAPSDKYRCPAFEVNQIEIINNSNSTPRTGWTERKLTEYWQSHRPAPMEGIYNFIRTSNTQFWGNVRHKLAVKKDGTSYQIIYLHGSNESIWTEGELKGVFSPTTTKGVYHVDQWFLDNKMPSESDFYLEYHERRMTLYDSKSYVETHFMKLFPAYDVDDSDVAPLYPTIPPAKDEPEKEKPRGNGSGFFISSNVVATNHHVIKDADHIEVVIVNNERVSSYKAKVLCVDKTNDIALLQIDDNDFKNYNSLPYEIMQSTIDVGSRIFTMGFPMANAMGREIKVTDGIISSKTGYEDDVAMYQITAPIQPGNSGGPMFNPDGFLTGITSSGIPGAQNVGYAIKSIYLNNLIDSAPIKVKNISNNVLKGKDLTEQIKIIKPYVVLILIY